jgi:hypothetical protein
LALGAPALVAAVRDMTERVALPLAVAAALHDPSVVGCASSGVVCARLGRARVDVVESPREASGAVAASDAAGSAATYGASAPGLVETCVGRGASVATGVVDTRLSASRGRGAPTRRRLIRGPVAGAPAFPCAPAGPATRRAAWLAGLERLATAACKQCRCQNDQSSKNTESSSRSRTSRGCTRSM